MILAIRSPFEIVHASSIEEEKSEDIAYIIQTQDTERQEILEHIENTYQTLTTCIKETASTADKVKEKAYDTEDTLSLSETNSDNMGTLAELPDELLAKVLSFKGILKAARCLCHYMEDLCFEFDLGIRISNTWAFDMIFNDPTRTIPNSYTNIKLLFPPSDSRLSLIGKLLSLKILDLRHTQVRETSPLAGLTALQRLELFRTQVRDMGPLADNTFLMIYR